MNKKKDREETFEEAYARLWSEDRPPHDVDINAYIQICKEKDEKYSDPFRGTPKKKNKTKRQRQTPGA